MEETLANELQTFLEEFEVLDDQEFWTFPSVTEHINEAIQMTSVPSIVHPSTLSSTSPCATPLHFLDFAFESESLFQPVATITPPTMDSQSQTNKKRKNEHVLGLINQYANELQKKRKMEEAEMAEQVAQEKRKSRMEIFDRIMEAFNTGDFNHMSSIVRDHCADNVVLKTPILTKECRGVAPILVFWGLLHETYPDAMTKILEKRVSSAASSTGKGQGEAVEYVYKFSGTRIVSKPVAENFNELIAVVNAEHISKQEDITAAITRQMSSISPSLYQENDCSFIAETVLTFDGEDKIIEWSYDILAAEIN